MRDVLRMFRNAAFGLVTCSAPVVCAAAVQLGVEVLDVSDGAAILAVAPGSLADANGLRRNDRIVEIGAKRIMSARDLKDELRRVDNRKRNLRITFMRNGGFMTVTLKKAPFRKKPFVAAQGVSPESVEQCLRSPGVDCLRAHLLTALKGQPETSVINTLVVATHFVRIGRPDLASEFLGVATESFIARSGTLDSFDLISLAEAHKAAGLPLPPGVLQKASQMAKQPLGLVYAVRGLHISGNAETAEQLLKEALATKRIQDEKLRELPTYRYTDFAIAYAVLGKLQEAEALKLDARFSPEGRIELDLAIAGALVKEGRYEVVLKALDTPLASYSASSPSIDGDRFSRAAWLYWQSGNAAAAAQIAELLVARTSDDIGATVEVLGLMGRIPEALTLIEKSMAGAGPARKAEVDYRLVSGATRRSGQNTLDARLRPVVERALANWRRAYAEATEWPQQYVGSISNLYRLQSRNGFDPPSASEMEWPAGPSIEATTRKTLGSAIATGVLTGLNEARRTDIAPAWALDARTFLKADRRSLGPLTFTVMLMAAEGKPDQAIKFGEALFGDDPQREVARDEARSINVASLVAARDFDEIARLYGTLSRPIQKMNVLLQLLIPIAGRCVTCAV